MPPISEGLVCNEPDDALCTRVRGKLRGNVEPGRDPREYVDSASLSPVPRLVRGVDNLRVAFLIRDVIAVCTEDVCEVVERIDRLLETVKFEAPCDKAGADAARSTTINERKVY